MKTYSRKLSGITLIEAMIAMAILAILAAVALPSFFSTSEINRVMGASDNLLSDFRYAQSESLKRNTRVHFVAAGGNNWTYQICLTNDCSGTNDPLRSAVATDYRGTSLTVNTSPLTFDPKRGTLLQAPATTTTMLSFSLNGRQVGLQLDPTSQYRLCSENGLGNYPACPAAD